MCGRVTVLVCVCVCVCVSGVGSNHVLRGPQIQIVGVALIIEFCDHNIPLLNIVFC